MHRGFVNLLLYFTLHTCDVFECVFVGEPF